ncbi:MAG: response regulator [Chloroflexaceae bacterium]|nr:response regulator [Chloroflexaceae bacterium]
MTQMLPLVLVIEDEPPIQRFLRATLTSNGYRLVAAMNAHEGLSQAATRQPDIIILDLGLPDLDGLDVTQHLREWTHTPIIVLSARGQEQDKIAALDAGANDYLTKPFGVGELLARMRVALRLAARASTGTEMSVFQVHGLRVDLAHRRVFVETDEVHLTPREYGLLLVLVRYAGRVVTHRQLLKEAWGPGYTEASHYLRVYMGHLRRKLESDPTRPRYLLTELGVGYRLVDE